MTLGLGPWWLTAAALAGEVRGRVLERGTGAPLAATLTVGDAELAAGADGRFTLTLPDGAAATLRVTTPDHLPAEITLTPPLDAVVRVFLDPLPPPLEVVVEGFRPTSDLTRHRVDSEMAYDTPGTYDDAVRLVASMPGVNVQREFTPTSGDVSVRGSLAGDSRFYLDGIEVPYLYHFNQYASVFPASQLDQIELFSSGFGARYGDAVGAIVEATSRTDLPDEVEGHASLNFVTVGADVRAPLRKRGGPGRGWWIGVGARRSFHDILGDTSAQFPLWPRFYDASLRAEHVGPRWTVGAFATVAGDRYDRAVGELDVLDPVEADAAPRLTYGRNWQIVGFRALWNAPRTQGRVVTAIVHDQLRADISGPGGQRGRTIGLPVRADAEGRVADALSWRAGAEIRPEVVALELADAGAAGPLVTREAPSMAWGVDVLPRARARLRAAVYGEITAGSQPVSVSPGVRLGLDSAGWVATVEPRLSARARLAEQTELRLAAGRYAQRPRSDAVMAGLDLPTTEAWQVGLGLDQAIAGRLEIAAEGYAKWLRDVALQPVDGPPEVFPRGEAFGAELTLRYRLRGTFFAWAWVGWGRAFVRDDLGARTPTLADQPWKGGVVVSWNVTPALNLGLRLRVASGNPFTDFTGSIYDATRDTWVGTPGPLNGARLPTYAKIDLHVGYTWTFNRWELDLSGDLWIVPPQAAALYPVWNYDFRERTFVRGPVALPLLTLRAGF